jgi:predicted DNA-binding transcriptional regulator AlpA
VSKKILERAEVCAAVRLTYQAIWKKMVAGTFPRPIELTDKKVGWFADEVDAYIASRPRRLFKGDPGAPFRRGGKGRPRKQAVA